MVINSNDTDAVLSRAAESGRTSSFVRRWLTAAFFLAAAIAISVVLREHLTRTIFVFFFFAIALTAWYAGFVQGLAVTFLAILATNYFLVEPINAFHLAREDVVAFLALGITATFIVWLTDALAQARTTIALHAEQLEEQARELEAQMEQSQMLTEEMESTNEELIDAVTRAEAANRAKNDFLAVMSHELRTPLNAIVGYSDLLQTGVSGPLTDTQKTHLSRIRASSFHLLDLIQDVLSFSRIEAGREELRISDVDVEQLARDAQAYIEQECARKGLHQEIQLPEMRLVMVTDPAKVRQILINLLNNACKFTDHGTVSLRVARNHDDIIFEVADTGRGIASEHLEKIFEPFTQVDQSPTREKGGAGLGLPVSRRLAHLLGGDLTVTSAVGQGSTFTLCLPVRARLS